MDAAQRQIWFVNAAHIFTHYGLLILATAVLAIVLQEPAMFGTDYGPILALGTGMFVLYGLGSLPMGWLAERFGRPALMVAFFLGSGAALVLSAFAPGPYWLAAGLALMGAFSAIYHPIGTAMLVDAAGARVGAAMGINGVFGNLGVALAPVVTAFLAAWLGWRWAFAVPGALCILVGLLYLREGPEDVAKNKAAGKPFPEIPAAVVRRAVVVLLSLATVSGFIFNAFTLLLPKLMAERLADSPDLLPVVGLLAFLVTICGGLTQFTVGRMIDRNTLKRIFLPLACIQMPGFLLLSQLQGWMVLPVAGVIAAAIFGQVTVNETMTARYVAPALRAKLYSIRFFVGFLGAAAASPVIAWLHATAGGLGSVLLLLAGVAAVTFLCALAFPDRKEELAPELWAAPRPGPATPQPAE
ncbi:MULTISPECIES: MFS transporter [Roseomonadaceae]|uniref:MFS transporter n=1 Tax=Falsiroseomonas oleicola TaxID=2801474 RepID=A0ABS6H3B7_9PROT|nr:MFS transporter [Roseomonas oleicola]MBU8543159.1 MFS transporter [Roseomonas oleicola]